MSFLEYTINMYVFFIYPVHHTRGRIVICRSVYVPRGTVVVLWFVERREN